MTRDGTSELTREIKLEQGWQPYPVDAKSTGINDTHTEREKTKL